MPAQGAGNATTNRRLRRDRGRIGHLWWMGRERADRAWPARAPARARQERRTSEGLPERAQRTVGVSASRRPDARDDRRVSRAATRLSAQREESRLVGERTGIAI